MSSKGRGSEVEPFEDYPTPLMHARNFCRWYQPPPGSVIVEPCAGQGNILRACKEYWNPKELYANEIQLKYFKPLCVLGAHVNIGDFRTYVPGITEGYVVGITNPPFSMALEVAEWGLEHCDEFIMLMRSGLGETQERRDWLDASPLEQVVMIPGPRPKFVKGRSDSTPYFWWMFRKGWTRLPTFHFLPYLDKDEQKRLSA